MINQAIQNRRSIRAYRNKDVPNEMLKEIIKAAQFAPTAMNNRSWEFIIVKDTATKEKLYELTSTMFKQDSIKNAPVVLIPVIDGKKTMLPIQDLSLAVENIFIQSTELGLGSFWKNVLPKEAEEIKKVFGIPEQFILLCIIPIGYPAEEVKSYTDKEFNESRIHWEKW